MKVSTCEKCAKGLTCKSRKDKTFVFTGICQSFISYGKARKSVMRSSALTYRPFACLKLDKGGI